MNDLEQYFEPFRRSAIGRTDPIETPYGTFAKLYADSTATGLPDALIEAKIAQFKRDLANTHTDSNHTGEVTSLRYEYARELIKRHVNASHEDVLILTGSGMTAAMNKLVRMMGLAIPHQVRNQIDIPEQERPVVFITPMEHHSNILPWQESIADVEMLELDEYGVPCAESLQKLCRKYQDRPLIGSFTAASNVTGIRTPCRELSRVMHQHGGVSIVDFAASAPYDRMDMHPEGLEEEAFDAITFSPHKFQGGVETPGVLVANQKLLKNSVPDRTGGGTVKAVDPWGGRWYLDEVEAREDGGTPPIIGAMRTALALELRDAAGLDNIEEREAQLVDQFMDGLEQIDTVRVFAANNRERLGIVSLYMEHVPHGLLARLLNDRFGIQVRNGCSCAGPYGHALLNIEQGQSEEIVEEVINGDETNKPGWVRVSLHYTMTNAEVQEILNALQQISDNADQWSKEYVQIPATTSYVAIQPYEKDVQPSLSQEFTYPVPQPSGTPDQESSRP